MQNHRARRIASFLSALFAGLILSLVAPTAAHADTEYLPVGRALSCPGGSFADSGNWVREKFTATSAATVS